MNIVRITTLLLLLSIRMYGWANNYSSMHIDSDNGLTQSNVKSITQDKYGFIWLGTKNGLNRYDGHQLLQFIVRDNEQHCSNQNVSALYSDRQGTLWVGTDEGLYYFDDAKDRFHRIITKAQDGTILNSWIANITEDNRGRIWAVAGDQGGCLLLSLGNAQALSLPLQETRDALQHHRLQRRQCMGLFMGQRSLCIRREPRPLCQHTRGCRQATTDRHPDEYHRPTE